MSSSNQIRTSQIRALDHVSCTQHLSTSIKKRRSDKWKGAASPPPSTNTNCKYVVQNDSSDGLLAGSARGICSKTIERPGVHHPTSIEDLAASPSKTVPPSLMLRSEKRLRTLSENLWYLWIPLTVPGEKFQMVNIIVCHW